MFSQSFFLITVICQTFISDFVSSSDDIVLYTVATSKNDGFKRFMSSAKANKINVKVLGEDKEWLGGDMNHAGGGFKISLFRKALENDSRDFGLEQIVMFTDSYDVIIRASSEEIIKVFKDEFRSASILFGSEMFCWPNQSLVQNYSRINTIHGMEGGGYPYLNSGLLIGYATSILDMLKQSKELKNTDDDQLFYTKMFLSQNFNIRLDYTAKLFQNLNGVENDIKNGENIKFNTKPKLFHGNGPQGKITLNNIASYLPNKFHSSSHQVTVSPINLKDVNILLGIYIDQPTPFISDFFKSTLLDQISASSKSLWTNVELTLYIDKSIDNSNANLSEYKFEVEKFQKWISSSDISVAPLFHSVKIINRQQNDSSNSIRNDILLRCLKIKCDYVVMLDSIVRFEESKINGLEGILSHLISLLEERDDMSVVAPLLTRHGEAWSNFWGNINEDGYYSRSWDYMDIVNGKTIGTFNVPYISSFLVIRGASISQFPLQPFADSDLDFDMSFCHHMRQSHNFMFITNLWMTSEDEENSENSHFNRLGYLINADPIYMDDQTLINGESHQEQAKLTARHDLYQIEQNKFDWEKRYISPDYHVALTSSVVRLAAKDEAISMTDRIEEVCPDVFRTPIVTDKFADDFIAMNEEFGQWSSGDNTDSRLQGGYENVPTRDIHMKQISFHNKWLHFLDAYVRPVQEQVFDGYFHSPVESEMNFIVRYKPDEQPELRPHHDSSTYTINLALNTRGVDFQGGGCRFLRYNCSVLDTAKGYMLIHPGRLTHFHEGLATTQGTRYIMISFINP